MRLFRGYLGARTTSRQRSRCPRRLPVLCKGRGEVYTDQRRGCLQGFTIARVHLYGKGRASVGLIFAVWGTGTEPAHSAIMSHSLQLRHATPLSFRLRRCRRCCTGRLLRTMLHYVSSLICFLHSASSSGVVRFGFIVLGIGSCSGRALFMGGGVMIRWLGRLGRCVGTRDHATVCSTFFGCCGCILGCLYN